MRSEEIRKMITERMGRGVTVYRGKGGYRQKDEDENEVDVIFTVVTNLEITRLKSEIEKIDSKAFLVMNTVNETKGGTLKRRSLG